MMIAFPSRLSGVVGCINVMSNVIGFVSRTILAEEMEMIKSDQETCRGRSTERRSGPEDRLPSQVLLTQKRNKRDGQTDHEI